MNNLKKYLNNGEIALAIIFNCSFYFFSFASEYFFTLRNIMNVSGQLSIILIASIGFAVLLIAGEVDISIGSLLAFVALPLVQIMNYTESVALGIVVCLIFGAIIGLINGFLSIYLGISSLIVTLGMILRAVYLYTGQRPISDEPIFSLILEMENYLELSLRCINWYFNFINIHIYYEKYQLWKKTICYWRKC